MRWRKSPTSCARSVAFLANAARLLQGYLGTDQVSFCENARASDDPGVQEVPVRAEGASLGLLRIRAPAPMDAFTLEFLETLGNLMGEPCERIDQETLLSDTEEYYQLLAASTDSAIVIFDAQGRIRGWNAAAEKMYEYSASEVVGRSCAVLYSEEDVARGKPEDDLCPGPSERGLPEEAIRKRRDGELFVASARTTALIDDEGSLRGYARTLRDITARKKSETELRRNLAALDKRVRELRCLYEVAALISDQALPLPSVMRRRDGPRRAVVPVARISRA